MGNGTQTTPADAPNACPTSVALPTSAGPAAPRRLGFRQLVRRLGPTGPMALLSATMPLAGGVVLLGSLGLLSPYLQGSAAGPVLCVLGFAAAGGFALLPTAALSIFAGWSFGFNVGFPTAMCGFLGAACIGYALSRRVSGERVVRLIEERPRLRAVYHTLLDCGQARAVLVISLLRLPAVPPFALTNLVLGSSRVRLLPFLVGTALGLMPRTAAMVFVASGLKELDYDIAEQPGLVVAGFLAAVVAIVILGLLSRRALAQVTVKPDAPAVNGTEATGAPRV